MAGISSKAAGAILNRYKYNGNEEQSGEFNDGSGLELYDFSARTYDQQIGRFIQQDAHSEFYESWTPYNFSANSPILLSDPTGLDWYRNNESNAYEWFEGNETKEGYTLMKTGTWSERDANGFSYYFGEGADGLIQSGANQDLEEVTVVSTQTPLGKFRQYMRENSPPEQIESFTGFWGNLNYYWNGGIVGKGKYNKDGELIGPAPMGGIAPTPSGKINLKNIIKVASSLKQTLPGWRKIAIDSEHILSGHVAGGSRVSSLKTLFPANMSRTDVIKTVRDAYRNVHSKLQTQGDRILVVNKG